MTKKQTSKKANKTSKKATWERYPPTYYTFFRIIDKNGEVVFNRITCEVTADELVKMLNNGETKETIDLKAVEWECHQRMF